MPLLYAEGFEVGSAVADLGSVTSNAQVWTTVNVNATTTATTLGPASSGGSGGRSVNMTIFTSTTSNGVNQYSWVPIPSMNSIVSTATTIIWGFRGKLNPNYGGLTSGYGSWIALGTPISAGGVGGFGFVRNSNTSAMTFASGTTVYGTVTATPDYNWHYYTVVATRSSSNWICKVYVDSVLTFTATVPNNFQTSNNGILYAFGTGAAAGSQVNIFSEIDDVYVNYNDNPLGSIVISKLTPTADVQAQWTRYGTGVTTNYGAVTKNGLDDATGVTGVSGNADLYSVNNTVPAGYQVNYVNVSANGIGTASDSVQTTAKSGSLSITSPATTQNPFGGITTTGWDNTLAGVDPSTIQYGITKI